jgi:hypothetical protein
VYPIPENLIQGFSFRAGAQSGGFNIGFFRV